LRDNDGRVSWQSGTAEAEEDCILGIEHHFFGNGAASKPYLSPGMEGHIALIEYHATYKPHWNIPVSHQGQKDIGTLRASACS